MRLNEAIKIIKKVNNQILSQSLTLTLDEIDEIKESTARALTKYLNTFYRSDDKDYTVFYDYFNQIIFNE